MALGSLGHYRLDERLGQGGMGEVFRAFDTRLNRRVAIKVMLRADGADATAVERFLREARAASALNHPNIVTIHEVGETPEGGYFIVQELVEGRTLRAMLADSLPLPTMLDIARQTARALAAAHAAGIVHRDIKPENIMVRGDGYVKVLDFGLARIVDVGGELSTTRTEVMTAPGTVIGTTPYMSPEQAHGDAPATPTDIFSLGVALYEMIGGKRPFVAPTALGVLAAIVGEQPVPLCRVQPTVPPEIDALVERMLAKPPHLRPTAREVEEALAAGTAGAVQSAAMSTRRSTVGRDAERAALALLYDQARAGRSRLVAVSGEAGIGKTSLIEDVLADLAARPDRPVVGRGRCSERLAGSEAFLPILDALDHLLHRGARESVRQVMKSVAPTWYAQVAAGAADESGLAQIREDVRAASPERMKRELAAFFADVSRVRPAVLFIDDLHWADVSTVDLLNYVTSRFDDMRLLIVATFRPAEMALAQRPFLAIKGDLLSRGVFEEIALRFLEPADVDRYLALEFPDHALPDDFAALVHEKTEGNPLFMADLVRYLRDSGAIMEDGGRFRLASDLPDLTRALPESVKGMIQRKIEQVDERDRKILIAASVQGHQFDAATVAEAVEMDPADVEERLEVLERVHVFVERGVEQEFPDLTLTLNYQFVHVLYQNILYSSLQPARRASLSGRVAKALVRHHGERVGPIAGRVAVLFEAARDFATSAQYYFMASQHAAGLHAFVEARALTERGLDAIRGLPEGPQRIQLELGLQMIRGLALRMMKGWAAPELEPVFTRARQLCHSLADPPELVPVLWALTLFYAIRGNLREYRERAEEVLRLAEQSGNPAFIMGGYHLVGVSGEFMGDMLESRRVLEQGIALHVPGEHLKYTAMYGLDPGMICRAMSSRPIWVLGYPDLAEARARETLALGRSQKQPMTLAFALLVMEGVHLYRGEPEKVIPLGDEVIQLAREFGLAQEKEWGRAFQASAFTQLGRLDEGIDQLKDSLAVQQAIGSGLVRTAFLALLADPLCRAGRIDEGLKAIDEGFTHAKTMSEGGYLAELHRMRGELLRKGGDRDGAETAYRAALAHAAAQQAKSFELRAATGLATLLLARNRRDEARAVLAPVHGWFTEGHDTLDLRAARAALVEIG